MKVASRNVVLLALTVLTLSVPVSVQAQKATPPPAPPTSQPPEPTKAPPEPPLPTSTPNPVPTVEPTLEKPTVAPTPTPDQAKLTLAPTPLGVETTSSTPVSGTPGASFESGGESLDSASVTTATITPPQVTVITGLVFDDRDSDCPRLIGHC